MTGKRKATEADRAQVLALLSSGLILQNEAATLASVTRQRIHQWVRAAGIAPIAARARFLRGLMPDDYR